MPDNSRRRETLDKAIDGGRTEKKGVFKPSRTDSRVRKAMERMKKAQSTDDSQ